MVVNLHFQFGKQKPITVQLDFGTEHGLRAGDTGLLGTKTRRKIRESYKKAFHRRLVNTFTFHHGQGLNPEHNFDYNSRELYRLVIPEGRHKHLWTNGRRVRTRVRNRFGRWRWQ